MLILKQFPRSDYTTIWERMKLFTEQRQPDTSDELWLLEHNPVYTQGLAGKPEHILNPGTIPIVHSDRGGQVTYHGPGQLIAYTLFDLNRLNLNTRCFVQHLENNVIELLQSYNITAYGKRDAPGVYINDMKIASIGLRVKKNYAYHGLALNVAMDLEPFSRINPCGFESLKITQIADFIPDINIFDVQENLALCFQKAYGCKQGDGSNCIS